MRKIYLNYWNNQQSLAAKVGKRLSQIGYEVIYPTQEERNEEINFVPYQKTSIEKDATLLWLDWDERCKKYLDQENLEAWSQKIAQERIFHYGNQPIQEEENLIEIAISDNHTTISEDNHLLQYFTWRELEQIKNCEDEYLKASVLVRRAFQDKKDKSGEPYIEHLHRVSDRLEGELQVAGLLHDIVEDTEVSCLDLLEIGFFPEVVRYVFLVTKPITEKRDLSKEEKLKNYEEEIDTIIRSKRKKVTLLKEADMDDNYNPQRRSKLPEDKQEWFEEKYGKQLIKLRKVNKERNQELC